MIIWSKCIYYVEEHGVQTVDALLGVAKTLSQVSQVSQVFITRVFRAFTYFIDTMLTNCGYISDGRICKILRPSSINPVSSEMCQCFWENVQFVMFV